MSIERLLDQTAGPDDPDDLYKRIEFPDAAEGHPYVYINMGATVDGKIVLGKPGGSAAGVGGPTDQALFRRLQRNADGALIGAATLRASQVIYPPSLARFVATRSGDLPLDNRFFRDAPDRAFVLAPEGITGALRRSIETAATLIECGAGEIDWSLAMRAVRDRLGIRTLLCEGGASVNDQLIRAGLVDELFLTLSPKLKGGAGLPTIVDGIGFPEEYALPLELLSIYHEGGEIYLRYRLGRATTRSGKPGATA
jgi:riboflavin biosynthesis pyrimidine reductase